MSEVAQHNVEAEESVLGAILMAGKIPNEVLDTLSPKHFYRNTHAMIYTAALTLHSQGKPVTVVALHDQLQKAGQLDNIGGSSRLSELVALTPAISTATHHAEIVRELASLRELLYAGQEIQRLATHRPGDLPELIRMAENALHAAANGTTTRSALSITEGLDELIAEIRDAYASGQAITGLSTGFHLIDQILHGMWPKQLILCAARTGVGKTTLAQNIAENVADKGIAALLISLEMSRYELQLRSLARAGRIDGDRLSTGQITPDEAQRLGPAISRVKERTKLLVHDDGVSDISMLSALARRHTEQHAIGLLVVDYIGLVQAEGKNNYERVSQVSRALKLLAQNLDIPVLALAQMNRKQDDRSDKRPMLSDLRDSGSLEQDADVVMFLHRESDHDPDQHADGSIEVIIEKNRKGRRGVAKMLFTERYSRFHSPTDTPGGSE